MRALRFRKVAMSSNPLSLLPWLTAGAAALIGALRLWKVLSLSINARVFVSVIQKFAMQSDLERIKKLCNAAGDKPLSLLTKDLLSATQDLPLQRGPFALYQEVARACESKRAQYQNEATKSRLEAALGALLVAASLLASQNPSSGLYGLCLVGALLLFWGERGALKLRLDIQTFYFDLVRLFVDARLRMAQAEETPFRAAAPAPLHRPSNDTPAATTEGPVVFAIYHGDQELPTRSFPKEPRVIKVGRIASAHILLEDHSVSRMHAVIEIEPEALTVIDLGSTSGTFVNGEKVNKKKLHTGDTIKMGDFTLIVKSTHLEE